MHSTLTSSAPDRDAGSFKNDAWTMGLVGLAHASSHFSHLLLPLMFPVFLTEFGLSYSELGLLSTLFFLVSGVGQATVGAWVDRHGPWPVLLCSLTLFVLACALAAVAQSYLMLMGVAVLAGLGNCAFHPVDFSILNRRISSARLGYAFSVHGLTGNLGWAAAPVFLVGLTQLWGWREAYACAALLYIGILVLLVLNQKHLRTEVVPVRANGAAGKATPSRPLNLQAILRMPVLWWCFAFFLLSTMALAVVQNFIVPIVQGLFEVGAGTATQTLTAYMLLGALGMLIGGWVSARFAAHTDRIIALCMCAAAACMLLCASGLLGPSASLVILALTGFAVGIGGPSRDMMIKKATPVGATGRVYGFVYSGLDIGFSLAPAVFGLLMDRHLHALTLSLQALLFVMCAVCALWVTTLTRRAVQAHLV